LGPISEALEHISDMLEHISDMLEHISDTLERISGKFHTVFFSLWRHKKSRRDFIRNGSFVNPGNTGIFA